MGIAIWLDDVRNPFRRAHRPRISVENDDDIWWVENAKSFTDAIDEIISSGLDLVEVHFDHDLGLFGTPNGFDCALYLERKVKDGEIPFTFKVFSQSANPEGARRILQVFRTLERRLARASAAPPSDWRRE